MPIPNIIERMRVQYCVYWAPTLPPDNYGQVQFATPVELRCRWVDCREVFLDRLANEQVSRAKVRFADDILELGVLWLGRLTSITPAAPPDPFVNENAWQIRKVDKIPNRWGYDFLRIAWL